MRRTLPTLLAPLLLTSCLGAVRTDDAPPPVQAANARPCPVLDASRTFKDHGRTAVEVLVKMDVDVDGAPNAYGPKGKKTLDILAHARALEDKREVVGYMTEYEGGPPTIQGKDDPYPGYYVSQTDFADKKNKRMEDPQRYVDAGKINYVVQGKVAKDTGVQLGDFAVVYSCRTGKTAYAIVGDSGNESGAEGSLALVQHLGYTKIVDGVRNSVDDREIVIRYYPHSNPGEEFFKTQTALDEAARKLGLTKS